jgi:hypothetical protein
VSFRHRITSKMLLLARRPIATEASIAGTNGLKSA